MSQRRKLVAILAADAVGYSRLMADDERATIETLNSYRKVFHDRVTAHDGRVVDSPGDALLAEFPSAVEGVQCAVEIQQELTRRNLQLSEHRRMHFRIGLNLGDVVEESGALYGDGVNVAARLQALAEPGGICLSAAAFDQVEGKVPWDFKSIGEQQVKNIPKPIQAYQVVWQPSPIQKRPSLKPSHIRGRRTITAAFVVAALAAVGAGTWWWLAASARHEAAIPLSARKQSIAVLPFANMSGDPNQEYLSDGITEDIITALARFTNLSVVARNSAFAYKGKATDVRQVGKELGARYVVEGSVQRSRDAARVTAQLIDASDGSHVWAEHYDRELKDLFSVKDEITQQIVGRLTTEVDRAQLERVRQAPAQNYQAYDLVLQARKLQWTHSEAQHRESRELLERAIALDHNLAPAYLELAWVYLDEYRFGWNPRPGSLDRALEAATRAVELEPENGFAHWRLAKVLFFRHDITRFEIERQRALALNPNYVEILGDMAVHLAPLDRVDEAYKLSRRTLQLDPNFPTWIYFPQAAYFYRKHRYQESLDAAQQIAMPDFFYTHFFRAIAYAQLGEMDKAHAEAAEVLRLKPDFMLSDEGRIWNNPKPYADQLAEGARKAGLAVWPNDRK
jgi:TolB-like protein/class 3 adenylate cyclase